MIPTKDGYVKHEAAVTKSPIATPITPERLAEIKSRPQSPVAWELIRELERIQALLRQIYDDARIRKESA